MTKKQIKQYYLTYTVAAVLMLGDYLCAFCCFREDVRLP